MKKLLFSILFSMVLVTGITAQQTQTSGKATINIEAIRVIGDQLLVSGKISVKEEARLMNIKVSTVDSQGDNHDLKVITWGGKPLSSIISFDQTLQPDIQYSFDLSIETKNRDMNPISLIMIDLRNWTTKEDLKFSFRNVPVPLKADPNLKEGVMEISKDVYLRWTKFTESTSELKISFVVENKATKEQEISFRSFSNAKLIDDEGNIYDATLSFKDRTTFPVETPIAGTITVNKPLKMKNIKMVQFESYYYKYSVKTLTFSK